MPKKILRGTVVSTKMSKVCVVLVNVPKRHPIYKKNIKNTKRFKAFYDISLKMGDTVVLESTRPISKEVTWKVIEVI